VPQRSRRSPERISVWSRRKLGELDKRTAESLEERRIIADLQRHVRAPTAPQRYLIKHTARTMVMLTLLDHRVIESGDFGDLAMRQLVALSNSVRLGLQALGLERAAPEVPSLTAYLDGRGKAA
jgi:hypothetical protein